MATSMKSDTKGKDRSLRTAHGVHLMMNVVVIAKRQKLSLQVCRMSANDIALRPSSNKA